MTREGKVLVTGATGFVGSHLTKRLLKIGYDVSIFRRKKSNLWRLKDMMDKLKIYEVDLQNLNEVKAAVDAIKPKIVFHLAAYGTNEKEPDINNLINTNVLGTINLLKSLDCNRLDVFVNTGTWWEYGDSKDCIAESHRLNPINAYAVSKTSANFYCKLFHDLHNYPTIILRPFSLYGTYEDYNRLIPYIIISAMRNKTIELTGGKQRRDYLFVEDLVDAYIAAMEKDRAIGEIFNIGTGVEYSLKKIEEKILKTMGSPVKPIFGAIPYRKNEIWRARANISKAKKILGWRPKHSFDKGIEKTINWFEENLGKYYE